MGVKALRRSVVEANVVLDYLKGLLVGGVVVTAGLAVVSQSTLPDRQTLAEQGAGSQDTEVQAGADTAPKAAGADVPAPSATEAQAQAESKAGDPASEVETGAAPGAAEMPAVLDAQEGLTDEPLLRPIAEAEAPPITAIAPDLQVGAATDSPSLPASDPAPAPAPEPATEASAEPAPEPAQTAPADQPAAPEENASEPVEEPAPETADPPPAEPLALAEEPAAPSTLAPDGALADKAVDGVTTGRLPTITTAPTPEPANAEAETALPEINADLPPVQRFARPFENPAAKPLFAILLVDPGTPDLQRAELAALPLPLSFVVDPMQPNATEAAAIYRAAGQEVVMLATAIPKGANASDLEQSFAAVSDILPEALALIDTAEASFQDNRSLSAEVVTHLEAQGMGLVTFDRELNAAGQVARREGLPSATVFRSLDDEGEDSPLIRRYLDRAAFKAAQEGRVVVIGTAREATVTALMEWAVEGRAASVALAPISAVMAQP
ncbi:MAG: hypothetical protein FJX28_07200 [Alphaproteobacteria bacterium]|nr:hypothetical protein [Alphaproteobacteria bacterium]